MTLFKLTLAYDGTDFEGWQVQSPARSPRTVQGTLEGALRFLSWDRPVRVAAAGRTDAGVHAEGQVVSFELHREIAPPDLVRALNGLLPPDVRVLDGAVAPKGFHARRSAVSKLYRYVLDTGPVQLPTRRRTVGHFRGVLDPSAVQEVARLFLGRRDFRSLAAAGGSVQTFVRHLTRSEAVFEGGTLVYWAEADGFLRQMVRNLVGGLVAAGSGARTPGDLMAALEARERRRWPPPAEARGLTLVRVAYA
jgi:tRNA pseudouridine38-40 synthase